MEYPTQQEQDGAVIKAVTMPTVVEDPPEYVVMGACAFSLVLPEGDSGQDPFADIRGTLKLMSNVKCG
ncbi:MULTISPECIES: hypothetical protein [unclassified Burkholderia]|uniref:hypothetical protein n=1 Tax=unclassified Burkholderia TaxID=2613784 RepID=UPI002AB031E3|nr:MULTISPECIES: hypothetical protein [unclassified Burkholderia]